ncbi:MAG: DsbA family protein [Solirubrobacterales bacterium]
MSDKTEREKRRQRRLEEESRASAGDRRKKLLQLAAGAVFLVLVVVVALIVVNSSDSGGSGDSDLEEIGAVDSVLDGIPQQGLVLGKSSAPVELVEFGDLQCPVCKAYSEDVLPQVIENQVRTGKAKIVFRNFTIISEESVPAGAAAIAAGAQGRGWNYIELFYRNQGEERSGYVTDDFMTSIAKGAGVKDVAKWNDQRAAAKTTKEVEATTTEAAQEFGFEGTPSFLVKGPSTNGYEALELSESPQYFEEAIEKAG